MATLERLKPVAPLARQRWLAWVPPLLVAGWVLVGSSLAVRQHAAFHTHLFDTGYYTQVLWNTSRGDWFANSLKYPTFLADHFSPALLALAPLFWIAPSSYPLQIARIVALGLPALPLCWLLRQTHPTLAPALALAYVFSPLVHQTALEEFHEIVLAAPPIALACAAASMSRPRLLLAALGCLLLVREDMGIVVALFGLYLLCVGGEQRRLGAGLVLAGAAWTLTIALAVMPLLRAGSDQVLGGAQASAKILAALADPGALLRSILTPERGWAVATLLIPLAGLPLLARGEQILWGGMTLVLLALPLSSVGGLGQWYVAPLIPLLWAGAAAALARMPFRVAAAATGALLLSTAVCFAQWSPFPGGARFTPAEYEVTDHHRVGHALLAGLPPDAPVVTQSGIGAHLAARRQIALYPWNPPGGAGEIWVFDTQNPDIYPLTPDEFWAAVERLRRDPSFALVAEQDGYLVFERRGGDER